MFQSKDCNNVERVRPEGGYLYQFLQEQEQEQPQAAQPEAAFAIAGC